MQDLIIYRAIKMLEKKTKLKATWETNAGTPVFDGYLTLNGGQEKHTIPALVKKDIKTFDLVQFQQLREFDDFIIIAEVIYPVVREQLIGMGINYMDIAGNCFIENGNWMFHIEGMKNIAPHVARKDAAFTKTALVLLFHFLNDEDYLNVTYRRMAEDYGIAIGNINKILTALKKQGFLLQYDKKRLKLTNKKELLEEWITAYEKKLKPTLEIGQFNFMGGAEKDWKNIPIVENRTQWGGEPAGALLTDYLKPARLTLYTEENRLELFKQYRMAPDENGHLKVYKKFWKFTTLHENTVPPILVYADLINTGDPRNIETARKLYDGLLKDQF